MLLAQGLPCESYLDTGNRSAFANGGTMAILHADFARGVWAATACAELVLEGPRLTAVRKALLEVATAAGHAITEDADLQVLADGRPLPVWIEGVTWHITLPADACRVRLVSNSWIPGQTRPAENDMRTLGIAVSRLKFDGSDVTLDDARLSSGWHPIERGEGGTADWRWTDGDAGLALAGVRKLSFKLAMTGTYWQPWRREYKQQANLHPSVRPYVGR